METNASKSSFEGPLKHLGESCPVADRALAALTIALMCNEGTIPEDTDTVGSIHHGLFSALKEEDRDLKVCNGCRHWSNDNAAKMKHQMGTICHIYNNSIYMSTFDCRLTPF
jgi:hypothetical protein